MEQVVWFDNIGMDDVSKVGGKNASLGEMIRHLKDKGIKVPDGFATTAEAYRSFLKTNGIENKISRQLDDLHNERRALAETGKAIREMILDAEFPPGLSAGIKAFYKELGRRYGTEKTEVAVRSSATAEDLPEASFAGQQESFLNIAGDRALLDACKRCYASLFTDRAISYRAHQGFQHMAIALSVGIQKMIRSDKASAGVAFTLDPETGFRKAILINSSWGLGESVVKGLVNPDEFIVYKPLLDGSYSPIISRALGTKEKKIVYAKGGTTTTRTMDVSGQERNTYSLRDEEVLQLAKWSAEIERHYGRPMDIEWAKDGERNELYIVQARPETVQSQKKAAALKTYRLKQQGEVLVKGLSIGQAIAAGKAQIIRSAEELDSFREGGILVTGVTDPDWEPIMKAAAGIVTDHGGRTSHAAIVSRELGIPAVVGTGKGTQILKDGQEITLSCAEGDEGIVYDGILAFETTDATLQTVPATETDVMMNIANPAGAFGWWQLPAKGIGLARIEFIINNAIKIHPMALVRFDEVKDRQVRREINELTRGYADKTAYFIDRLASGIGKIAASVHPCPAIVRMSDFKTNEYADLIGGKEFEPVENNPMLGFRGASRYTSERYREGFALECRAVKKVREEMGLTNVIVMIPFCRTPEEARRVVEELERNGLKRGAEELQIYVMAEVPSNIILAEEFAQFFDGFSIGSNDLTQLVLGVDRDSEELSYLFDERHEAVQRSISSLIRSAHKAGRRVGLCGEAPSNHPDFAAFLVRAGIDSISVNPDSFLAVLEAVAEAEKERRK